MPRRSHLRVTTAAVVVALTGSMLSACGSTSPSATSPIAIATFAQTAGSATACQTIMRDLPAVMNHQKRRASTGSEFGAAWGDPPIVVRCGVSEPSGFNAYASCQTVNGIDWFLEGEVPSVGDAPSNQSLTVTTVYRKPAVQVVVPDSYGTQGPSTAMALLTAAIKAHTTVSHRCV